MVCFDVHTHTHTDSIWPVEDEEEALKVIQTIVVQSLLIDWMIDR